MARGTRHTPAYTGWLLPWKSLRPMLLLWSLPPQAWLQRTMALLLRQMLILMRQTSCEDGCQGWDRGCHNRLAGPMGRPSNECHAWSKLVSLWRVGWPDSDRDRSAAGAEHAPTR